MSTAAMLVYPDFFKVAVSSSGNHENNIYNRWWSEKHHGVREVIGEKSDTSFLYAIEKNSDLAKNLKGRLLLSTGDIDNNVHPGKTDYLVKLEFSFAYLSESRHKNPDIVTTSVHFQRHFVYQTSHISIFLVREHFCSNV